jgi:hypothetical protein
MHNWHFERKIKLVGGCFYLLTNSDMPNWSFERKKLFFIYWPILAWLIDASREKINWWWWWSVGTFIYWTIQVCLIDASRDHCKCFLKVGFLGVLYPNHNQIDNQVALRRLLYAFLGSSWPSLCSSLPSLPRLILPYALLSLPCAFSAFNNLSWGNIQGTPNRSGWR